MFKMDLNSFQFRVKSVPLRMELDIGRKDAVLRLIFVRKHRPRLIRRRSLYLRRQGWL